MPYYTGEAVWLANYTGPTASPAGGYKNSAGTLYDPTTPTLTYLLPGGTVQTINGVGGGLVKDAVGLYHFIVTPAKDGDAYYMWTSNDGAKAVAGFKVEPSPL